MTRVTDEWQPIDTLPDAERILVFFEHGAVGGGEMVVAMVFRNNSEEMRDWSFWTWGGPSGGSDWDETEKPTHWRRLPADPNGKMHR